MTMSLHALCDIPQSTLRSAVLESRATKARVPSFSSDSIHLLSQEDYVVFVIGEPGSFQ